MAISNTTAENGSAPTLTPKEIERTFDKLKLRDPAVREFYEQLDQLQPEQEQQYWTRIHTTSDIPF